MSSTGRAVFNVHIKGTIDAVWHEITKTDDVQACFFNMRLHTDGLKPGGQIRMQSASGKYTGVVGEAIAFDPPTRFSHTFRFTQYDDPPCTVTYDLVQLWDGVAFTMTCTDIPTGTRTERQMKQGGPMIVDALKAVVERGKPSLTTRMMYGIFRLMEPLTPKVSRSENWPLDKAV